MIQSLNVESSRLVSVLEMPSSWRIRPSTWSNDARLSARSSAIVETRARELGITHVLQGQSDKQQGFTDLLLETALTAADCCYAGDDLPDLPVLRAVGFAATVADACDEVKSIAHWIAPRPGGSGAVRALAEYVLRAKGIDFHAKVLG